MWARSIFFSLVYLLNLYDFIRKQNVWNHEKSNIESSDYLLHSINRNGRKWRFSHIRGRARLTYTRTCLCVCVCSHATVIWKRIGIYRIDGRARPYANAFRIFEKAFDYLICIVYVCECFDDRAFLMPSLQQQLNLHSPIVLFVDIIDFFWQCFVVSRPMHRPKWADCGKNVFGAGGRRESCRVFESIVRCFGQHKLQFDRSYGGRSTAQKSLDQQRCRGCRPIQQTVALVPWSNTRIHQKQCK